MNRSPLSLQILISRNVDPTDLHTHADTLLNSLYPSRPIPLQWWVFAFGWSKRQCPLPNHRSRVPCIRMEHKLARFLALRWRCRHGRRYPTDAARCSICAMALPGVWRCPICARRARAPRKLEGKGIAEKLNRPLMPRGIVVYDVGFGRYIVSPEIDTKGLDREQWKLIVGSWLETAAPWRWEGIVEKANTLFPIVSGLGVPCGDCSF